MSFQDELNKNSKTPAEVDEELRKTMVSFSKLFGGVFVSLFGDKFRF